MDTKKMKDTRFASLTYKELQALASKYSVPGNIKKHLLVQILEAVERGNLGEVKRVLKELQQNRKKRVRKTKNDKLANVTSTPAHSPNYHQDEEREYYPQPSQSYQWVAPDAEISLREEDQNRVPSYEEFHKFLMHRMCAYQPYEHHTQQYYYDNSSNERSESPSIVDLRVSTEKIDKSIIQSFPVELPRTKSIIAPSHEIISENSTLNCQIVDATGNIQSPMLLKKMLQAPAGTNLKDLATVDGVYTILSTNHAIDSTIVDDSDTETAESESNGNDDDDPVVWENNGENYYCLMAESNSTQPAQENIDPLLTVNQNILNNSPQDQVNQDDGIHNYNHNNYGMENPSGNQQFKTTWQNSINDSQRNCQKWILNSTNANNSDNQFLDQNNANRMMHSMYSSNQSNQINMNNLQNFSVLQENFQFQGQANNIHGNVEKARDYKNPGDYVNPSYQNFDGYPPPSKIDANFGGLYNPNRAEMNLEQFYHQVNVSNQNSVNVHGVYANNSQENGISPNQFRIPENPWGQFNHKYPGYNINGNGCGNGYNNNNNHSGGYYQQNVPVEYSIHENRGMELEDQQDSIQNERNNSSVHTMKPTENNHSTPLEGVLDTFRPRWTASGSDSTRTLNSSGYQLENTLNIRKFSSVDRSKIDETSCVYCYTAPIVSNISSQSSTSSSSRKKEYSSETRKHSFSTYFMIYEDSSAGLKLANLDYLNVNLESPEQRENQGEDEINQNHLNNYYEYMNRSSMETSDSEEIINNDVWINQNANFHNPMSNSG